MRRVLPRGRSMGVSEVQERLLAQREERSQRALAARLPGGSAWNAKGVLMWKRSEVERLTGLTRHMIQDLCNQNVAGDGLGFWEPAVSKPGYSRFDEGDLLAFFLVRQLTKAGFTLKEIEPAVFDLLEEGDAFSEALRTKERQLHERRAKIDDCLQVIAYLEDAAEVESGERLLTVMGEALEQSVFRAVAATKMEQEASLSEESFIAMVRRFNAWMAELVLVVQGALPKNMPRLSDDSAGAETARGQFEALAFAISSAKDDGESAAGERAREVAWMVASCIASERDASRSKVSARGDATRYAMRVLAHFFSEPENGVPVELVLGKGSFQFMAQATEACVKGMDARCLEE